MESRLRLYQVWRSGNDNQGPDGADTVFVVRALDHVRAGQLVDADLRHLPHKRVRPWCDGVCCIGIGCQVATIAGSENERVIVGPAVQPAYKTGQYACWHRFVEDGPWVFEGICPQCGFDFSERLDEAVSCGKCGWDRTSYMVKGG